MATITLKGNPIHTNGELPEVGATAPDFVLVAADMSEKSLADFKGKKKVLTINPSYDTSVCQMAARAFNEKAAKLEDVVVLAISSDLPFAQKRFCTAEGLDDVIPLSTYRSSFLDDYGAKITDGPLQQLAARAIVVIDENDQVAYTELVPEIAQEPNYDAALAKVS